MRKKLLIFLGGTFESDLDRIEQILPQLLSEHYSVFVFEYPRFRNLFQVLSAKRGFITELKNGTVIIRALGLPFGRNFTVINKLNHQLSFFLSGSRLKDFNFEAVISFTPEVVFLLKYLQFKKVIYYVVDNYTSLPAWNSQRRKSRFAILEKNFRQYVSEIICVSVNLRKKYENYCRDITVFPTPCTIKPNLRNNQLKVPEELTTSPLPVIGFSGDLNDWRTNITGLVKIIASLPEYLFVFTGTLNIKNSAHKNNLLGLQNFRFMGKIPSADLGTYISDFDVCIIPYDEKQYLNYAYPVKIAEFLYYKKPVVVTALPALLELSQANLIYTSHGIPDFINKIRIAVNEKNSGNLFKKRRNWALKNTWKVKLKNLYALIEK